MANRQFLDAWLYKQSTLGQNFYFFVCCTIVWPYSEKTILLGMHLTINTGPFILCPQFLQFVEIWFKKSGSRNLVWEKWFEKSGWPEKKGSFIVQIHLFYGSRKVVDKKKKSEFAEPIF